MSLHDNFSVEVIQTEEEFRIIVFDFDVIHGKIHRKVSDIIAAGTFHKAYTAFSKSDNEVSHICALPHLLDPEDNFQIIGSNSLFIALPSDPKARKAMFKKYCRKD